MIDEAFHARNRHRRSGRLLGGPGRLHASCAVGAQDKGAPAFVTLQNVLPNAYQLYITDGNRRLDVGNVAPLQTVQIKVPAELVYPGARLALLAQPTLSGRNLTVPFTIHPGATVRLMLGR